jgi:hypothetical protein
MNMVLEAVTVQRAAVEDVAALIVVGNNTD